MRSTQSSSAAFELNSTEAVIGVVLVAAGGIIGISGMIIGGHALFSAARQWFSGMETPPTEVVRHKYHQTKAATMAGAHAWQEHNGVAAHSGRA